MPRITVIHEAGEWHHQLGSETVTIGRDEGCDIRFNDRSVAGVHCRIVPRGEEWIIENADADYFTLVNGKVADLETLHSGDRITVGNFALVFDADADFSRERAYFADAPQGDGDEQPPVEVFMEPCKSCGELISPKAETCAHCGVAVTADPGPAPAWKVEEKDGTITEGLTVPQLVRRIDEHTLEADMLVSGPPTGDEMRAARKTSPLAKFLGHCHACDREVEPWQSFCHACRSNLQGTDEKPARTPPEARSRRTLYVAARTAFIVVVCAILVVSLLASGVWRPVVSARMAARLDALNARMLVGFQRLVGPRRFGEVANRLKDARAQMNSGEHRAAMEKANLLAQTYPGSKAADEANEIGLRAYDQLVKDAEKALFAGDRDGARWRMDQADPYADLWETDEETIARARRLRSWLAEDAGGQETAPGSRPSRPD